MGVVVPGGVAVLMSPLVMVNDPQVVMGLLGQLRGMGMGGNVVMREFGRQGLLPGADSGAEPASKP